MHHLIVLINLVNVFQPTATAVFAPPASNVGAVYWLNYPPDPRLELIPVYVTVVKANFLSYALENDVPPEVVDFSHFLLVLHHKVQGVFLQI